MKDYNDHKEDLMIWGGNTSFFFLAQAKERSKMYNLKKTETYNEVEKLKRTLKYDNQKKSLNEIIELINLSEICIRMLENSVLTLKMALSSKRLGMEMLVDQMMKVALEMIDEMDKNGIETDIFLADLMSVQNDRSNTNSGKKG